MNKKFLSMFIFVLAFSVFSLGFAIADPGNGNGSGEGIGNIGENGMGEQVQTQMQVQDGIHMGEGGQQFQVKQSNQNQVRLEANGVAANCDCDMKQEKVGDKTKLFATLSNGKNSEIKIMPNIASETALEKLKLKTCSEEEGCQIELKEVGSGDKMTFAYELKTQKRAKVFGLFGAKMQVQAQVNAEDGELIRTKKSWWAFLASEPEEASTLVE